MKMILALCLVLGFNFAQAANILQEGQYQGKGIVTLLTGQQIPFTISTTSAHTGDHSETITDTYAFPDGTSYVNVYDISVTNSIMTVTRNGIPAGTGYCVESSCHLTYFFADTGVSGEESLIVSGDRIERIGSRSVSGVLQYVKTSLVKVK
ncbi:MAG: hypothetical protein V4736_12490 [Bdellovibrionota bacterium]